MKGRVQNIEKIKKNYIIKQITQLGNGAFII